MTEGIWRERIFDAKTDFWHMSSQVWTWISMQSSNTESKRYFCKAWMWNGQIVSFGWFNVHRIGAEMRAFWRVSASLSQFWLLEVVRGVHVPRKIAVRRIHFWGFLSSKMSILRATSIFHRTDAWSLVRSSRRSSVRTPPQRIETSVGVLVSPFETAPALGPCSLQ